MAQFFYDLATNPGLTAYLHSGSGHASFIAVPGATDGLGIGLTGGAGGQQEWLLDSYGSGIANCQVVARFQWQDSSMPVLYARYNGATSTGYALRVSSSQYSLMRFTGYNTSVFIGSSASLSLIAGNWYWMRLEVTGTTVRARVWADGSAEPTTWGVSSSDSNIVSGGLGFGIYGTNTYNLDWIGIGTDGHPAPTVPQNAGQFYTDFSEYPVGQPASDWARAYGSNGNVTIRSRAGSQSGQVLELPTGVADADRFFRWTDVPASYDIDIRAKFVPDSRIEWLARWDTSTQKRVGMTCDGTNANLRSYSNATSPTTLDGAAFSMAMDRTQKYWARLLMRGTGIWGKFWEDGSAEPATWLLSGAYTGQVGVVGVQTYFNNSGDVEVFSVGINGWVSPAGPISAGETISFLVDTRQRIYTEQTALVDSRQRIYSLGSFTTDTEQRVWTPAQSLGDTRQRVYVPAASLADTKQRIGKTFGWLSDTRQKVYKADSLTADTKQRVYQKAMVKADTRQVVYGLLSLLADTRQRVWVGFSFLADTMQVIGAFGSALRKVALEAVVNAENAAIGITKVRMTVDAMIHCFGNLTGTVSRRQSLTATVRRRDDA